MMILSQPLADDRKTELRKQLQAGIAGLSLSLSSETCEKLLDYLFLLKKWNQVYNLTAIEDETAIITKHILDCLAILPYVQGERVLDVGTGAGLPGLILAICQPAIAYTLVDRSAKKIRFIQQVISELQLKEVTAVQTRIEDFSTKPFDIILSRAFTQLLSFYQMTQALCKTQGQILVMKGIYPQVELQRLTQQAIQWQAIPLTVPFLSAQRHLIRIQV